MRASLSIAVSKVDLLAERCSRNLPWHWYIMVFSVPPPQRYEAGDPDLSKDLQHAESFRRQGRSKGVYSLYWTLLPATPKSKELKDAWSNTPAFPLAYGPHKGSGRRREAEQHQGRMYQPPAQSQPKPLIQAWNLPQTCVARHCPPQELRGPQPLANKLAITA